MPKLIGKKLKSKRKELDFILDEVEGLAGIRAENISRYEQKDSEVQIKTIVMLSVALGDPRDFAELTEEELDAFETITLNLSGVYKEMYGEEVFKKELNIK